MQEHLILVRHARVDTDPGAPASTWKLSQRGRDEVARFAPVLATYNPARILTSNEPKAVETGQILADALGLPVSARPGLQETDRETAPWYEKSSDFQAAIQRLFENPDDIVFGEESASDALHRFQAAVSSLIADYPDQSLAVVTHGTILSLFVAHHNAIDPIPFWKSLTMPALVVLSLPTFQLLKTEHTST